MDDDTPRDVSRDTTSARERLAETVARLGERIGLGPKRNSRGRADAYAATHRFRSTAEVQVDDAATRAAREDAGWVPRSRRDRRREIKARKRARREMRNIGGGFFND